VPALDGEVLEQAGAATATRFGPEQPFEVVTLPQIEPTPSVNAVHDGRVCFYSRSVFRIRIEIFVRPTGA